MKLSSLDAVTDRASLSESKYVAVGGVIPKLNDLETLLAVVLGLIVKDLTRLSMTKNIGSDLSIINHRPRVLNRNM